MATQTTYQHKNDKSISKTFLELKDEFMKLRYADDEFAREYASHEINQWINHNYETIEVEIETPKVEDKNKYLLDALKNCAAWIFSNSDNHEKTPWREAVNAIEKYESINGI